MGSRLYVGNISWNTSTADLSAHFAKYGEVKYAKVITDQATGRSKGFGFVEMGTDDEAQKAIESADGFELGGRAIRVSQAQERAPRANGSYSDRRTEKRPSYDGSRRDRF